MSELYASKEVFESRIRGLLENTSAIQSILTLSQEERISLSRRITNGGTDFILSLSGKEREVAETMHLLRPLGEVYNRVVNAPDNFELARLSFDADRVEHYVSRASAAFEEAKSDRGFVTITKQYVFAFFSVLTNPDSWGNFGEAFSQSIERQETKRMAVGMRESLIDAGIGAPIASLIAGIDHEDRYIGAGPAAMQDTSDLNLKTYEGAGGWSLQQMAASATVATVVGAGTTSLAWKATPLGGTVNKVNAIYSLRSARAELAQLTDVASRGAAELGDEAARLATMGDVADSGRDATQTAARIAELRVRITDLESRTGGRLISSTLARTAVTGIDATRLGMRAAGQGVRIGSKGLRAVPVVGWVGGVAVGGGLSAWIWTEGEKTIEELKTQGLIEGQEEWLRGRLEAYAALENDPFVVFSIGGQKAIYEEVASQLGPQVAQRMFPGTLLTNEELSYSASHYKDRKLTKGAIYEALRSEPDLTRGRMQHPVSRLLLEDANGSHVALQGIFADLQRERSGRNSNRTYTNRDGETVVTASASSRIRDWENDIFRGSIIGFDGEELRSGGLQYGQFRRDLAGNGVIYQQLLAVAGTPEETEAMRIELYRLLVDMNTEIRSGRVDAHNVFFFDDALKADYPLVAEALQTSRRLENGLIVAPASSEVAAFNDARDSMKYVTELMEVTTSIHYPLVFTPSFETIVEGNDLHVSDFENLTFTEVEAMLAFLYGATDERAPGSMSEEARDFLNMYEEYQKAQGMGGLGNNRNALEGAHSVFSDYMGYAGENFALKDFAPDDIVDPERYRAFLPVFQVRTFVPVAGANKDVNAAQKFDLPTFIAFLKTEAGKAGYQNLISKAQEDSIDFMGLDTYREFDPKDNLFVYFAERPNYLYQTIAMAEYIALGGEAGAMGNSRMTSDDLRAMATHLLEVREAAMDGRRIKFRDTLSEHDVNFLFAAWGFAQELENMHPNLVPSLEFDTDTAREAIEYVGIEQSPTTSQSIDSFIEPASSFVPSRTGFNTSTISFSEQDAATFAAVSENIMAMREANSAKDRRPLGVVTGSEPAGLGELPNTPLQIA